MLTADSLGQLKRAWLNMISELGKGAFGEVWKCTLADMANNVPEYLVAAKIVKISQGGDAMLQSVATQTASQLLLLVSIPLR